MLITKEEQLEMARQILQKLNLELTNSTDTNNTNNQYLPLTNLTDSVTSSPNRMVLHQRISVNEFLSRIGPLPSRSTFIGLCDDGLPLLFDLMDPTPGAIIISGSRETGKSRLLKTILFASSMLNSTDDFCFYVITPNPAQYRDLFHLDHCLDIVSSYDRAAIELIVNLASITEQRRSGRFLGPVTILAIDHLEELMRTEEFELTNHLKWLLENGPKNSIWPIATIQQEQINSLNSSILSRFKTNLTASNGIYQLAYGHSLFGGSLINPFTTRIGPQRINFWIPEFY